MDKGSCRLTVFFQPPFWNGVFERSWDRKLSAAKVIFGAEPKDYQVYEFVLKNYDRLRFSPAVAAEARESCGNPKRMQREARRQMKNTGIGTKSQQALHLQQEQLKTERKITGRKRREAENARRFELKQQKKKEKHKGR